MNKSIRGIKKGQFTSKGSDLTKEEAQKMSAGELKERLATKVKSKTNYIPLNYFANKKKYEINETEVKNNIPKSVFGFANKERLNTAHHKRHASEMGYKDQRAYEKGSIDFWASQKGKLYFSPESKCYYLYNNKENLFLAVDKEGIIHTFMVLSGTKFSNKIKQEQLYEIM